MKKLDLDIQLFASSGSFGSLVWGDAPYTRYTLTWYATQNIAGNYTDVTATLFFENMSGYDNETFHKKIVIGGWAYNDEYVSITPQQGTAYSVATRRIYHDANGNGSAYISACDGNLGGWAYFNQINRYANFTGYYSNIGYISWIDVYWWADRTIDYVRYYLNGSSTPIDVGEVNGANGSFTVYGLFPATYYSIVTEIRSKDSQEWTKSGATSQTMPQSAKITSNVYNVNSVSSLGVTTWNDSGIQCDIYIELLNSTRTARIGNPIRHANTIETVFSVQEIQSLASLIPNSNTCNFRINTVNVIDGQDKYLDYKDGTYSVVNANPIFNNFTYVDSNLATVGLTGDNQKVIKAYSNVKATVSSSNKATAQQGATMSKYRLVIGSKQVDANYSSSTDVNLQLNNIDNNVFTIYAIDSRGNSTSKQISPSAFIDYFDRYFSTPLPVAIRTDDIGSETTLSFNGLFFNNTFGNTQNDITLAYKYKKTSDSTYTDGVTPLTLTKSENSFSFSNIVTGDLGANGFDANYSYNIRLVATDSLGTTNYDFILGTGKPNLAISKNGVAINGAYDETIGGNLQIGGKSFLDYTKGIGAIYESNNSTSPATLYGGTWVQLKDRFLIGAGGSYSAGTTGGEATHALTINEIPSHVHNLPMRAGGLGGWTTIQMSDGDVQYTGYTGYSGGGGAHNNMPPYLAVYMWYRSA